MSLTARVTRRLGSLALDVTLEALAGETLALVGESGSGKSTTLRLLAGLARPDSGRIELDGETWFDAERRVDLAAWRRAVGWVPQDWALFPHLDALGNAAFGLRALGLPDRTARTRAGAALERLGVAALAARRPHELSGGQQQRVALARALVLEPRLLLLDEPLSALDARTREAVRGELKRLLAGLPCVTIYVTHSAVEAFLFGDRVAVLEDGAIQQCAPPDDLARHPRTATVAALTGVNLFRGPLRVESPRRLAHLDTGRGVLAVIDPGGEGEAFAVVDPREITLSRAAPAGSAQNVLRATVIELVPSPPLGERLRVALDSAPPLVAEITREAADALGLRPGLEVHAAFKATGVKVFR